MCKDTLSFSFTKICAINPDDDNAVGKLFENESAYCTALIENGKDETFDGHASNGDGLADDTACQTQIGFIIQCKAAVTTDNPICLLIHDTDTVDFYADKNAYCEDIVPQGTTSNFTDNIEDDASYESDADCMNLIYIQNCEEELTYTSKVCWADTGNFTYSIHDTKAAYCAEVVNNHDITSNFSLNTSDGDGFTSSDECSNGCLDNRKDSCNPFSGLVDSAEKICVLGISDSDYANYGLCSSEGNPADCIQSDCCPQVADVDGALDPVCTDTAKYFKHRYLYCQHKAHFRPEHEDIHELPASFPVCGSDHVLYISPQQFCKAIARQNGELAPIDSSNGDTHITCCLRQCSSTLEPVIIEVITKSFRVYQNECIALCNHPRGKIVKFCTAGTSERDCEIDHCLEENSCASQDDSIVCGHDGVLYPSYCEAKCRGKDVNHVCVLDTKEDFPHGPKSTRCRSYCEELNGVSL